MKCFTLCLYCLRPSYIVTIRTVAVEPFEVMSPLNSYKVFNLFSGVYKNDESDVSLLC